MASFNVKPIGEVPAGVTCVICLEDIALEPVFLKRCEHIFCAKCITDYLQLQSECPTCRLRCSIRDVKRLKEEGVGMYRVWSNIRVECRGCPWKGFITDSQNHYAECPEQKMRRDFEKLLKNRERIRELNREIVVLRRQHGFLTRVNKELYKDYELLRAEKTLKNLLRRRFREFNARHWIGKVLELGPYWLVALVCALLAVTIALVFKFTSSSESQT